MLRPGTLKRYLSVMRSKGCSIDDILMGSHIDPDRLEDEKYHVEALSMHRVVENMIRLTGDQGIGFDVGLSRKFSDFGIQGYASLSGHNQLQNLQASWNRYGETSGLMTKLSISKVDLKNIRIAIEPIAKTEPVYRFFAEEVLGLFDKVGTDMNDQPPVPIKLELSYPEPTYVDRYKTMFNCPVVFNSTCTRVTYRRDWFEEPLKTCNPETRRLLFQRLEQLHSQVSAPKSCCAGLRNFFLRKRGEIPTLSEAAADLGISTRTLSRQLQVEDTSYRKEFERFQFELAFDLIKLNRKPIKEVSDDIGFSDADIFRRAFKRWTGMTIYQFRKTQGIV
jgi:AraC-like DNA-binding protein